MAIPLLGALGALGAIGGAISGIGKLGNTANNIASTVLNDKHFYDKLAQNEKIQQIQNQFSQQMQNNQINAGLALQQNQINNQQDMLKQQLQQQLYLATNAAQLKMSDLAKAGINPLLASGNTAFASGGPTSGNSGIGNSQRGNTGNQPKRGYSKEIINAKKLFIIK